MDKQKKTPEAQHAGMDEQSTQRTPLALERLLYAYSRAREKDDFDTVAAIFEQAETDPVLTDKLLEMEAEYDSTPSIPASASKAAQRVRKHLIQTLEEARRSLYPSLPPRAIQLQEEGETYQVSETESSHEALPDTEEE